MIKTQAHLKILWTLCLLVPHDLDIKQATVSLRGKILKATLVKHESGVSVKFAEPVSISAGQVLAVKLR